MRSLTFNDAGFVGGGFTVSVTSAFLNGGDVGGLGAGVASVNLFAASTGFCIGSTAPYTFSWGAISGSNTISCTPTNTSGTSFSWNGTVGAGACYSTVFRCTGVSAVGRTGVSVPVEVAICTYPGSPP